MNLQNQKFKLITLEENLPKFSLAELNNSQNFEWYYFDFTNEEYNLVIVFKIQDPINEPINPYLWIEFEDKNASKKYTNIVGVEKARYSIEENNFKLFFDSDLVDFHSNQDNIIDKIELHLDNAFLQGDIHINPACRGFQFHDEGYYIYGKLGEKISGAIFSVPLYNASATISYKQKNCNINLINEKFTGYTDHPYGSKCLTLTNKRWYWGKFSNENKIIQYANVSAYNNYKSTLNYVYSSNIGDITGKSAKIESKTEYIIDNKSFQRTKIGSIKYPANYVIKLDSIHYRIESLKPILDLNVYNRSSAILTEINNKTNESDEFSNNITYKGWTEFVSIRESYKKIILGTMKLLHKKYIKQSRKVKIEPYLTQLN